MYLLSKLIGLPGIALAQFDLINVCVTDRLSCAEEFKEHAFAVFLDGDRNVYTALFGVLFFLLVLYGLRLLFAQDDDQAISEAKQAYTQAIFGTVMVLGAVTLSLSFGPDKADTLGNVCSMAGGFIIIEPGPFRTLLATVIITFKSLVGVVLLVNIFRQGILLIISQEEDARGRAQKRVLQGMIGTALVLLADPLIETAAQCDANIATRQILGITNYLVTIFGLLSVVGIIVSGIALILSAKEEFKDMAKKTFITSIVATIIVVSAFAIVNVFIF